eukprot:GFKZ01009281.1.p1 GENE.GFKZ01009281.1~~GFKZ01009281.1.p1  ORF type:complete len:271 (-),score=9.21 GFKZ01009281.1:229-1041(-)
MPQLSKRRRQEDGISAPRSSGVCICLGGAAGFVFGPNRRGRALGQDTRQRVSRGSRRDFVACGARAGRGRGSDGRGGLGRSGGAGQVLGDRRVGPSPRLTALPLPHSSFGPASLSQTAKRSPLPLERISPSKPLRLSSLTPPSAPIPAVRKPRTYLAPSGAWNPNRREDMKKVLGSDLRKAAEVDVYYQVPYMLPGLDARPPPKSLSTQNPLRATPHPLSREATFSLPPVLSIEVPIQGSPGSACRSNAAERREIGVRAPKFPGNAPLGR